MVASSRGERRAYRVIDADQHINEPPRMWLDRVPARLRDRAPRMASFDEGDAWVLEGVADPINIGLNSCAGKRPEEMVAWCRWDDVRPGGYDPAARCEELDIDHIDACVLFPTPRLSHSVIANKDPEMHLALVRAYNDWLAEYCEHAPDRLGGLFMIPNRGIPEALAEIDRAAGLPGMRGALLGCYPHGDLTLRGDEDDAVWAALSERGLPVHIHVSLVDEMPGTHEGRIVGDLRFFDAPKRILQLVWAGVFDRFPDLELVVTEVDCGWVPYLKEQADDRYLRMGLGARLSLEGPPSEYIERHVMFTYITDRYGLRNRHDIGVDRMMWSSDFPHVGSNWPHSLRVINAELAGVPLAERDALLAGNARRVYGFGAGSTG